MLYSPATHQLVLMVEAMRVLPKKVVIRCFPLTLRAFQRNYIHAAAYTATLFKMQEERASSVEGGGKAPAPAVDSSQK
jgi:hypothetical protein